MNHTLPFMMLFGLVQACGSAQDRATEAADNKDADTVDRLGTADVLEDTDVAGQAVAAQIDDAIGGAAEDQDAVASMNLADVNANGESKRFRTCADDGLTAIVDIKNSASRTITFEGAMRSGETSFTAYRQKQRIWSRVEGEINCSENKKFAVVPIADMAGVTLDVTFKHERSRNSTLTNKKNDKTVTRSFKAASSGERHISWTSVIPGVDAVVISKEVKLSSTRKLDVTDKKGVSKSLEGSLATDDGAPLMVDVKRDATTHDVESRTLKSGTLVATGKDGGRIETSFTNVVYEQGKGCVAASGSIAGKVFDKDATEPKLTFEVTFDGESKTITFSNGSEYDYAPEGCELDEPSTPVEEATAADVQDAVKS